MRIAIDCRAVFQGMGGIGRYAYSLLQEFAAIDRENQCVCYFTHLDPPEPLRLPANFSIRTFQAGMIDERFDQFILPALLREDRIDVYHNPTFAIPIVRSTTKTVATIHDVVFRRHPDLVEPRLRLYLDLATRRSCKSADRLITVSDFSKREIVELYGVSPERITVIHNGVRPPIATETSENECSRRLAEYGLKPDRFALYVGSIEPKKNIDLLLRAFRVVVDSRPDQVLRLALAGPRGSEHYPVETRVADLGLSDKVCLLGYVPSDLLEILYRKALLFIYPSLYEGFGFPPLEAMARGVPTVVSNSSSLPEVVGDGALLIDPSRPESLADAILTVVGDPKVRERLSRSGMDRASRFSWRRSAEEHLQVFKSLVRGHENLASGV